MHSSRSDEHFSENDPPFVRGWRAYELGKDSCANPYDWTSEKQSFLEWVAGWKKAAEAGPNPYDVESCPELHEAWREGYLAGWKGPAASGRHVFKSMTQTRAWLEGYTIAKMRSPK